MSQVGQDRISLEKSKNFGNCSRLAIGSHTSLPGPLGKLPLVSSSEICSQTVIAGVIHEVQCSQNLLLRPIAGAGGVATFVTTNLKLHNTEYGVSVTGNLLK